MKISRVKIVICGVFTLLATTVMSTTGNSTSAQVLMHNDSPTLFINEKPYSGWIAALPYPRGKIIDSFADAGVHVYFTYGNLFMPPEDTEKVISQIIEKDPKAFILLNTPLHAVWRNGKGKEWLEKNPRERQLSIRLNGTRTRLTQSLASKIWRREGAKMLRKYISHLENSPVGKHIIGYNVTQYEGVYGGTFFDRMPDYSEPMREAFQEWVKKKYKNNVSKLRKAWNDDKLDFNKVSVASPKKRTEGELSFRNSSLHRQIIDYDIFASELMADYQIHFAKVAKEATNGKKIVGMYGGYITSTLSSGLNWKHEGIRKFYQNCGMFNFKQLADSPYIDYTSSPHNYNYRGAGEGISIAPPTGTWRLRNKLSIWEDDTRTAVMNLFDQPGSCQTIEETIEVFKRNFGYNLTSGSLSWIPATFFGYNACEHPDIMASLAKCQSIAQKSLAFPRKPNAEVAVFVDEESYLLMRLLSQVTPPLVDELLHNQLLKAGFPFDVYLLSDLKKKNFPDYKMYIFTNTFHVDKEMEQLLKKKLTSSKATALWLYAPGFVTDTGFSVDRISQITGIKVGAEKKMGRCNIKITDNNNPISKGMCSRIITFDTDISEKPYGPQFYVNDPEATILGKVKQNGKPGIAFKVTGNLTSIYSAAPGLSWELLRNIACTAGVHVYTDGGDIIYSNDNFLVIHAASTGEKSIKLPSQADVYDIYNEKLLARGVRSFKINMIKGTTQLFFTGDAKSWKPGEKVVYSGVSTAKLVHKNMHFDDVKTEKCFSISLKKHANYLWLNNKVKELPNSIPMGKQKLANVPFEIIDPKENNNKFMIVLRGKQNLDLPSEVKDIQVDKKVSKLYFLHTSGWMQADISKTMEYIIKYGDKSVIKVPIRAHYEIADGVSGGNVSISGMGNLNAKVACLYKMNNRYKTCGLYSFRWKNPHPDKLINSIDISSEVNTGYAIPGIVAITGEVP